MGKRIKKFESDRRIYSYISHVAKDGVEHIKKIGVEYFIETDCCPECYGDIYVVDYSNKTFNVYWFNEKPMNSSSDVMDKLIQDKYSWNVKKILIDIDKLVADGVYSENTVKPMGDLYEDKYKESRFQHGVNN